MQEPTAKIAPHEGREAYLVDIGVKPFAVIEFDKDPDQFNYVQNNSDKFAQVVHNLKGGIKELRFWRRGDQCGLDKYMEYVDLLETRKSFVTEFGNDEYQRRMGKIFGYTDEEIEAFIKGDIKCNCTKCRGVSNDK